jgi:hypothetical protein
MDKSPKIIKVECTNYDEWADEDRLFEAWVAKPALRDFIRSLSVTEAWDVEYQE